MMEIFWGSPLTFVVSQDGNTQKFSTIEQAAYWLRKKWPVADRNRNHALKQIDAAMHCMTTVDIARRAFVAAARSAGFTPHPETVSARAASPLTAETPARSLFNGQPAN